METLNDLAERLSSDRARAGRDYARALENAERAKTDMDRIDATLATLAGYGFHLSGFDGAPSELEPYKRGKAAAVVSACLPVIDAGGNHSANVPDMLAVIQTQFDLGSDPRGRLASYLSRDSRVKHIHGTGWVRASAETNNGPDAPDKERSDPVSVSTNQEDPYGPALV